MKAILTTLKLAVPAAVVLLLAGCITDPYHYRGGYGGDYYYGQPSVEYRHHGYYGDYGYPYYGGRSGWSFGVHYGYPYGYGRYGSGRYGYGGWPYYYRGWPPYPPIVVRPRPDPDPDGGHEPDGDDQGPPPWRDLDRLRTGGVNPPIPHEPRMPRPTSQPPRVSRPDATRPPVTRAPRPQVEQPRRSTGGNRMERVQRAIEERDER